MSAPTRIRVSLQEGITELRMLMSHPMESGLRKDAEGNTVPAHYITEVTVSHAGRILLTAQFGPSVSANPYLSFRFTGGATGDEVTVAWRDNRGEGRSDAVRIA